ncbi:MAG: WXG100 family type VII secretion target [Thermoflexales bacterium]
MSATKIRADYESLQKIAQSFSTESDQIGAMTKRIKSNVDALRGGDWVGPGATAFYQEMDSSVFPSLKRLSTAMGEAAQVTDQINRLMNGAERDAAAVLRGTGEDSARHKDGDTGAANSIVGGILGGIAGALAGIVGGKEAGEAASAKVGEYMKAMAERAAADQARQAAIQKLIDAGDRQGAVDESIKQYGIDVSAVKGKVTYDSNTSGEGETSKDGTVTIGDDAFTSPQWLASSIGHEALHAQQARDGRWNDTKQGVAMNETEAYDWEIRNAERNGLNDADKATLASRRAIKYGRLNADNKARADEGNYTVP